MTGKRTRSSFTHWLALACSAGFVATSMGAVVLATRMQISRAPIKAGAASEHTMRRLARPGTGPQRIDLPMQAISRVHVAVDLQVLASGTDNGRHWSKTGRVRVVLDTGASLPFGTAQAALRFPLATAPRSRGAEGFAGGRGTLYPLGHGELLRLSLLAPDNPRTVLVPVGYLAPTTLHDADVIAPPQVLAPIGGAVLLDFARHIFSVCESIDACRTGRGWHVLSRRGCPDDPGTIPVAAHVGGSAARLRLDTGAASLLFRGFYDKTNLTTHVLSTQNGSLTGISRKSPQATLLRGQFQFQLGESPALARHLDRLWLVGKPAALGPETCAPDGSLGTDALRGCQLLIGEKQPHRALLRCGRDPTSATGTPRPQAPHRETEQ